MREHEHAGKLCWPQYKFATFTPSNALARRWHKTHDSSYMTSSLELSLSGLTCTDVMALR